MHGKRLGYFNASDAVGAVARFDCGFCVSLRQMCLTMNIDIPSIVKHICRKGTLDEDGPWQAFLTYLPDMSFLNLLKLKI